HITAPGDLAPADDGRVVRGNRQRPQLKPFSLLPAEQRNLMGGPVDAVIGHLVQPPASLAVEVLQAVEPDALKEVALNVAHGSLDVALGLRPVGAVSPGPEPVVVGKVEKLGIPLNLAILQAAYGHGLHVVVDKPPGHTAKVFKRMDVAPLQDGLVGLPDKLDVEHPRHSSSCSCRTAPISRRAAAALGKMPTTSIRRPISRIRRSSGFVEWIFCQCSLGNAM